MLHKISKLAGNLNFFYIPPIFSLRSLVGQNYTRHNGMGILSCRQYCRTFRRRLIKDTLRQSILIEQLKKSLDIYLATQTALPP